jgi:hypothetical protein
MELLKKIEDLVAPLVGLSTDTQEKALPEVTDPEGIVEDEYCIDGRKTVGSPAEIAKERAGIDLSKCAGEPSPPSDAEDCHSWRRGTALTCQATSCQM